MLSTITRQNVNVFTKHTHPRTEGVENKPFESQKEHKKKSFVVKTKKIPKSASSAAKKREI